MAAQHFRFLRCLFDCGSDSFAEVDRQPVAFAARGVSAECVVDFDGDLGFEAGQAHHRIDERRQARVVRFHAFEQNFQSGSIAGAGHRQQSHGRDPRLVARGDRALHRLDPQAPGHVAETVAQIGDAKFDHLGFFMRLPALRAGTRAPPLGPERQRDVCGIGLQDRPHVACRTLQRIVGIERAQPRPDVDRRSNRAGIGQFIDGQGENSVSGMTDEADGPTHGVARFG